MNKDLILVKLGGSLITDKNKPFCARRDVIKRLAKEIKSSLSPQYDLIIGHGSGSFGHTVASKYQTQRGIINKESVWGLSLVANAAIQINRIVVDEFLKAKLPVVSFAPASFITVKEQKLDQILIDQIKNSLKIGIIPLVYGDIVMDSKRGFCIFSGETTLDILAKKLMHGYQNIWVILCGDTNGVLDTNGQTISQINKQNFAKISAGVGESTSTDVTGGMLHKVKTSLDLASSFGIQSYIINGKTPDKLKEILMGKRSRDITLIHDL